MTTAAQEGERDGGDDHLDLVALAGADRPAILSAAAAHDASLTARQRNWRPPSTTNVWPVIIALASEARNTAVPTTSCGCRLRLMAPRATP